MNEKRSRAEWLRRYASFVVILFIIAFGTSLSIRANLGSSPISAPPYILSLIPGMNLTMGQLTICMHVFFITLQLLLLRKNFEARQYTQILVSFLFGFYTDLTMWMTGFLQIPFDLNPLIGYPLRFIELLIGGAVLAFGIACEVRCDSLMLAGEGLPLAISKFLKKDFGKVKICSDTSLVFIGTIFMFIYFGRWSWEMVGVGTLVSMFYVGFMVRVFAPHIGWLDRIFIPRAERQAAAAAGADQWSGNRIVTIARTYGSGGNAVGEAVARHLGCPCYNRQIIDQTAREMGYSTEFVAENEQNLSSGRLWEMIFTDSGIPASMNPSKEDAIYVSQSRTIRELAHKGPCVIIGRLANWILRDDPHVLRVFVTSGRDYAVRQIADKLHLSTDEAARKVDRVNTGRANHCRHYTGKSWTDITGYDLVINTERTGIDGAVDMILRAAREVK
ncbi:cytidylate kinase family protein [Barnesiella viscericola]|uniref:cytidylate kinase family protein n=1 Tax=Barnesiella viscericola TaxID=397865 RepID=UPI00255BC92B|nr:cytidylate kinase family protein [Barnesiella viscericola]